MKGYFITIEGSDGSGKSTQLKKIISYLEEKQVDLVVTREPGGTDVAEAIRKLEFHQKVYEGYDALCKKEPERICRIDASGTIEEVFGQIKEALDQLLDRA